MMLKAKVEKNHKANKIKKLWIICHLVGESLDDFE
jgi:hypothetical protein